ncbi:MAG: hypothetical protein ACHQ9S_25620 [Candidatus Binatia bacterium]
MSDDRFPPFILSGAGLIVSSSSSASYQLLTEPEKTSVADAVEHLQGGGPPSSVHSLPAPFPTGSFELRLPQDIRVVAQVEPSGVVRVIDIYSKRTLERTDLKSATDNP